MKAFDVALLAAQIFNVISDAHNKHVETLALNKTPSTDANLAAYIALRVMLNAFEDRVRSDVTAETWPVVEAIIEDLKGSVESYTMPDALA
jgi:hypothetical protein